MSSLERARVIVIGCVLALLCLPVVALVVCQQCGHEGATGASCAHCGAGINPGVAESTAGNNESNERPSAIFARELAVADMERARQLHTNGDLDGALLFLRNALALNLITHTHMGRDERAAQIAVMIEACERTENWHSEVCSACRGGAQGHCRRCGGRGRVQRRVTVDERKYALGQATQRYRVLQQGHSRVALGGAWVTAELIDALTIRENVTLRRSTAPGCRACIGLGRADCSTCSGRGGVDCRQSGCEEGVVVTLREGLEGTTGIPSRQACPACQGRAVVGCSRCHGGGSLLCRSCNGSGNPDGCRRCGGDGLSSCRRCRGAGIFRDQSCTACKEEGVEMCQSCSGTGVRL